MPRTGYNGYSAKLKRNYATIEISLGLYTCWVPPSSSFPSLPPSPASIPHTFWQIPFTCQTFAICGQHILKLAPACAAHHTHHTTHSHTQSLHTRPHNNNSIAQPPLFPPLNRLETEPRLCLNFVNYLRILHLQLVRILIFDSSLKRQQQQQH